jgi:hypothetical protein
MQEPFDLTDREAKDKEMQHVYINHLARLAYCSPGTKSTSE